MASTASAKRPGGRHSCIPRRPWAPQLRTTDALAGSAAGSSGTRSARRRASPRRRVRRSALSGMATLSVALCGRGKRKAAWARPTSQRNCSGKSCPAPPVTTAFTESPERNVEAATRAGGLGSSRAGRPSTVTVLWWRSIRSTTASPSGL